MRPLCRLTALVSLCAVALAAASPAPEDAGYKVVRGFPQFPPDVTLGAAPGVAVDAKGNLLVFHRGDPQRPILAFDKDGKFLRSIGAGLLPMAHGLRVDAEGNIWATDVENHVVVKFVPDGKVLMTLGEKGVAREDENHFDKPTDVAFAPNGDVYVSDGYGNSRVVKFDKSGKFLHAWGKKGVGDGEFNTPHAVRLDSKGRVYVADRENKRIQVFDQDGKFLRQFANGVSPYGLFITPDDTVFVADGIAHRAIKMTTEGKVLSQWGTGGREPGNFLLPHGICVGPDGAVYVAEITGTRVQKFTPN